MCARLGRTVVRTRCTLSQSLTEKEKKDKRNESQLSYQESRCGITWLILCVILREKISSLMQSSLLGRWDGDPIGARRGLMWNSRFFQEQREDDCCGGERCQMYTD